MAERPLLVFPVATLDVRSKRPARGLTIQAPDKLRQAERLTPQFSTLRAEFERSTPQIRSGVMGAEPEKVLVLELAGSVERFLSAVRRVPGLEWLAEFDIDDLPPTLDFHRPDDEELARTIRGQLYLVMSNRAAVDQLLSLWNRFVEDEAFRFPYGQTSFRDLFMQLLSIRTWGPRDRLRETGLVDAWRDALQLDSQPARAEIELWYRSAAEGRAVASETVRRIVEAGGGRTLRELDIEEIAYHALVAEIPREEAINIAELEETELLRCDEIMFMRPVGQAQTDRLTGGEASESSVIPDIPEHLGDPVVALLDGLPLSNHPLLANRLMIDDPDDWETDYPVPERTHGTWMASLILNGNLQSHDDVSQRRLYCRPIMRPDASAFPQPRPEHVPPDQTYTDIVYRSVRRMFEGEGDEEPPAKSVRIVNLSICDRARPLGMGLSSIARVVDWLSLRYGVLFIISAGNQGLAVLPPATRKEIKDADTASLSKEVLQAVESSAHLRRILAPSEAINALSVGGAHADSSTPVAVANRLNPHELMSLPAIYNSVGPGFRRAIKPDVLSTGGRQFVDLAPGKEDGPARLDPVNGFQQPGLEVATPAAFPGAATVFVRGTSVAAAMTTRIAETALNLVEGTLSEEGRPTPTRPEYASLLKAIVVHGANWGDGGSMLHTSLSQAVGREARAAIARYVGYGAINPTRVLTSTDQRVNLIGWGTLQDEEAHLYQLPIPEALSGNADWRRLTLTLAYLSPTNLYHLKYRQASLWVEADRDLLAVARNEADWQGVTRGTVQHEVLEGRQASPFKSPADLELKVNCRADAGRLSGGVPYGLMVTLEVAEESEISLFEEIRTRLRPQVQINP